MIKTLSKARKQELVKFRIPRNVQDCIPIRRIWADGIFQVGHRFSKTWSFTDINYSIAGKDDKTAMFLDYCDLLNALDSGASAKITLYNRRINKEEFEQSVLLPLKEDGLDNYREEFNEMLRAQVTESNNSIVRERYLTISVVKRNIEEARTYFARIGTDLTTKLAALSSLAQELLASRSGREKIADVSSLILVIVMAAAAMLPIWWIFRSSLMTNTDLYAFPPAFFPSEWRFSNYIETLETYDFWRYLKNTMIIIVPSVFGGTVTATLCGYAFARLRFRGKKFLFTLCIGSMLLPNMVTLLPLYLMWTRIFHLSNSYLPLILPYFCGGGAFNIFLIRQFICTIPRELDEAATIDGAGPMRILVSIILPAIRAAMIVVALFLFIALWNDLLQQTIYIDNPDKYTIAIGLSMFRSGLKADWAKIMCATCMAFVPGVLIYLVGQRYFVEGIVMTGMKN